MRLTFADLMPALHSHYYGRATSVHDVVGSAIRETNSNDASPPGRPKNLVQLTLML